MGACRFGCISSVYLVSRFATIRLKNERVVPPQCIGEIVEDGGVVGLADLDEASVILPQHDVLRQGPRAITEPSILHHVVAESQCESKLARSQNQIVSFHTILQESCSGLVYSVIRILPDAVTHPND